MYEKELYASDEFTFIISLNISFVYQISKKLRPVIVDAWKWGTHVHLDWDIAAVVPTVSTLQSLSACSLSILMEQHHHVSYLLK